VRLRRGPVGDSGRTSGGSQDPCADNRPQDLRFAPTLRDSGGLRRSRRLLLEYRPAQAPAQLPSRAPRVLGPFPRVAKSAAAQVPSCLVLDVRLPRIGGLEFQEQLACMGIRIPIVFITAHGDIPMTARAMKAGAVQFLTKPFQRDELLAAGQEGIERDRQARVVTTEREGLHARFASLSLRERDVMALVTAGLQNKQIAARLDLAEITVKVYRRRVMQKMWAASLPDLVRMATQIDESHRRRAQA
jgi:FixJ family two-component response regulator